MNKRKWINGGPLYEDEQGNTRIDLRAMGPTYVRAYRALRANRGMEQAREESAQQALKRPIPDPADESCG